MRVRSRSFMVFLACCPVGLMVTAAPALAETPPGTIPTYSSQFGSPELSRPAYDSIDGSGNVWVTDSSQDHVYEYTTSGSLVRTIGSEGAGNGEFTNPMGVAVNKIAGDLYVADQGNNRVEEFSASDGKFIRTFGSVGKGNGQFYGSRGIAVDSSGNVWVTDLINDRVEEFSGEGAFIRTFGTHGSGNGQFSSPFGITADAFNHVYVVDYGNNRVEEFTTEGTYLRQFGSRGSENGQFSSPWSIDSDPRTGNLFVTDLLNQRVQVFTSLGTFLGKFGSAGTGNGQFSGPQGIAINSSGDVYVVDSNNSRVQKWLLPTPLTGQPGWYSLQEESGGESSAASVNVAGGNLVVENEDLSAEASTANVRLDRFYNSQATATAGPLGPGWSWDSGPDVYLTDFNESVVLHGANGYVVTLHREANGTYTAPTEFAGTLTKNQNGTYMLTEQEGVTDTFNATGVMTGYTSEEGQSFTVADTTLSGRSVLHSVAPPTGKPLEVAYSGTPRVTTTTDPAGHVRHYEYNAQNLLMSYTDPAGKKTEYGYDANNYLNKITTPNGTVETITTVGGKVSEVTITPKGEAAYSDKFVYQAPTGPTCSPTRDAGETIVTHPPENGTPETYCWEGLGEITAYSGPSEGEEDPNEKSSEEQNELPANTCYPDPEFPSNDCGQEDPLPENEEGNGLLQPLAPSIPDLGPTHYGIADNNSVSKFNEFTDPHFQALHVVNVRRSIPWDTVYEATHNPSNERAHNDFEDLKTWIKDVKVLSNNTGQPTISIDICGQTELWVNPITKVLEPCTKAPLKPEYELEVKEFLTAETLKEVNYFTAWNEPNNTKIAGEPSAPLAGRYWRVLDGLCSAKRPTKCQVAAGEFIDYSMPDANDKNMSKGGRYFEEYYLAMGHPPTAYRWAWHAYGDGEATYKLRASPEKWWTRFKNFRNAINRVTKGTHKSDIWLTEQGVLYTQNGEPKATLKNAGMANSIMHAYVEDGANQLTRQSRQIQRFFYYQMRGEPPKKGVKTWDSSLLLPTGALPPHTRSIYGIYHAKTPKS